MQLEPRCHAFGAWAETRNWLQVPVGRSISAAVLPNSAVQIYPLNKLVRRTVNRPLPREAFEGVDGDHGFLVSRDHADVERA